MFSVCINDCIKICKYWNTSRKKSKDYAGYTSMQLVRYNFLTGPSDWKKF